MKYEWITFKVIQVHGYGSHYINSVCGHCNRIQHITLSHRLGGLGEVENIFQLGTAFPLVIEPHFYDFSSKLTVFLMWTLIKEHIVNICDDSG